jgi:pyruvate formate lyase activating enzyme
MEPARYWHEEPDGIIRCDLCPHRCRIPDERAGCCRVRRVADRHLWAWGFGQLSSINLDPIEKKPLYHFYPGARILSIGGWGCNFSCHFCQNWSISQKTMAGGRVATCEHVVEEALRCGSIGVAYTYNEPCINIEYVMETARRARAAGLVNVLVTNGYINREPAIDLLDVIDAANVDLKSMDEEFYRKQCGGSLEPVKDFCRLVAEAGRHLEITNLVIPGLNDAETQLVSLAEWIASSLGHTVPLHLSAYRPMYKMHVPQTPTATLVRAHALCRRSLDYVYLGNVMTREGRDTLCPGCGAVQIARIGYGTRVVGLSAGACSACGRPFDGIPGEA